MPRLVSWPMYCVDPAAVDRFWTRLRRCLCEAGLADVPERLSNPIDLLAHWSDPSLLLSQTCGYPYVTRLLGAVRYVATPRFQCAGCEGAWYRSAVVVREDDPATGLDDLKGRIVAFNGDDSHSGYNALRHLVATHGTNGRFFGATVMTGSHRASMQTVADRRADAAAIDVVTLALLRRSRPELVAPLRVLCLTAAAPGLPLITAAATTDEDLERLRIGVAAACRPDETAATDLLLLGAEPIPANAYDIIDRMERSAARLGYPRLS